MPGPEQAKKEPVEVLPTKEVSAKALTRLGHAKAAIEATKRVLSFGAGNQEEAIRATRMNSKFRMDAMRTAAYWTLAPDLIDLARANPEALTAAKADMVHGGNCGEHGWIAYHHLRQHATGEYIERVTSDIDHGFVLLGDRTKEKASDMAVADAWPTKATATLWEDHFCYDTNIESRKAMVADGNSIKETIAAGLKLSEAGKAKAAESASKTDTDAHIADDDNHVWNQVDSAETGKKFNYTAKK
jgi:hypothetical protein